MAGVELGSSMLGSVCEALSLLPGIAREEENIKPSQTKTNRKG